MESEQNELLLKVFVFNVGQGDNILLQLPDGSWGIIDFHFDSKIHGQLEPPSLTFLKKQLAEKKEVNLSFFHLSHYHADHIGGLKDFIEWAQTSGISTNLCWLPGSKPPKEMLDIFTKVLMDSEFLKSFFEDENNKEYASRFNEINSQYGSSIFDLLKKFVDANCGQGPGEGTFEKLNNIFRLVDCCNDPILVNAYSLAPTSEWCDWFEFREGLKILRMLFSPKHKASSDGNDISAILLLQANELNILFGGDAKQESIESSMRIIKKHPEKLNRAVDFSADFVKIFHHGASYSSSEEIWETIIKAGSDVYIAISAGKHEGYSHPSSETINHIVDAAASNNATVSIFATNYNHITGNLKIENITQANDILNLSFEAQLGRKSTNKRFIDLANCPLQLKEYYDSHSDLDGNEFWGYCFEFDLINKVKRAKKIVNGDVFKG